MRNPSPRAFNLDASLLQCDLLLSFFLVKSSVTLGEEEVGGQVGWKETSLSGPKGYARFYSPAHTGHVRYTRASPNNSKKCFLSSNPLFCYFLVQKVYNLDPSRVSSLSLSNAIKKIFSFPNIWHIQDFAYLREIERDIVDCGLKKAMSCVISQSNNQGEL